MCSGSILVFGGASQISRETNPNHINKMSAKNPLIIPNCLFPKHRTSFLGTHHYCWCFRNPENSPSWWVGSWNPVVWQGFSTIPWQVLYPMIYAGFSTIQTGGCLGSPYHWRSSGSVPDTEVAVCATGNDRGQVIWKKPLWFSSTWDSNIWVFPKMVVPNNHGFSY